MADDFNKRLAALKADPNQRKADDINENELNTRLAKLKDTGQPKADAIDTQDLHSRLATLQGTTTTTTTTSTHSTHHTQQQQPQRGNGNRPLAAHAEDALMQQMAEEIALERGGMDMYSDPSALETDFNALDGR